jgi:hypothetical protein
MDAETFKCGKHKGKTFRDVRINHTEYFVFLADKIPGNEDVLAYHHIKFIEYCMGYLRLGHENKWLCT